jgi:NitT/TauT family transport system substrate-binding protein
MTPSRRRVLCALTALAPLAARPAALRAQNAAGSQIVVHLTAVQPDVVPFLYSVNQKAFERAGLDISYQAVTSGSLALVAVLGGAANIGFGNPFTLVAAFAKGAPIQLVAPGSDAAATATTLFVLPDSPIRGAKDMEGRVMSVTGLHDLNTIGTRTWTDANGGDSTKIRFVELAPSANIAALQAKRIDVACLFEPFRTEAIRLGLRPLGAPYGSIARSFLVGAWFADRNWVAQHRDAVARFAEVLRTAGEYADNHYEELIPFIASYTKMEPDLLRRANHPHFPPAVAPAAIQPLIDVAARYREIPAAFRAEDMILRA